MNAKFKLAKHEMRFKTWNIIGYISIQRLSMGWYSEVFVTNRGLLGERASHQYLTM